VIANWLKFLAIGVERMSDKLQFLIEFLFRRNRNGLNVRRNGEYRRVNVQEVDDEDLVPGKLMSETF
jgi:hypothetical protein